MTFDIRIAGADIAFACAANETVLDAAERAGYSIPYSCRKGVCSTCAGILSEGTAAVRHQQVSGPREGVLLCQARPLSDSRSNRAVSKGAIPSPASASEQAYFACIGRRRA